VVAVLVRVMLARFFGVMRRMVVMTSGDMRVMRSLFMIAGGVVLGGGAMVARGVLVVLGSFKMVLGGFSGHGFPFYW
jgi:hypothetical protein